MLKIFNLDVASCRKKYYNENDRSRKTLIGALIASESIEEIKRIIG